MWTEELIRWGKSLLMGGVVFAFFAVYLILRRGYFNLYIANKAFGSTAAILAGLTLLIGPLAHRFPLFERYMTIRRHLGLLAFALAFVHTGASLWQSQQFPLSWYLKEWAPIAFGIVALLLWSYLAYLSKNEKIKTMGAALWAKHQHIVGHIAFIAVFLHLTIMKFEGWTRWFTGQTKKSDLLENPSYPPASLFVFAFMLVVLLYRGIRYIANKFPKTPPSSGLPAEHQ